MLTSLEIIRLRLYFAAMQETHYKTILYFIIGIIGITLAMQVYWNFKSYESGKQQLVNEVQISLDNAVNRYYTNLTKKNLVGFTIKYDPENQSQEEHNSVFKKLKLEASDIKQINVDKVSGKQRVSIFAGKEIDKVDTLYKKMTMNDSLLDETIKWYLNKDTLVQSNTLAELTSRVIVAVSNNKIDLATLDSLTKDELSRKKIELDFGLQFTGTNRTLTRNKDAIIEKSLLSTTSKSSYLPKESKLMLFFTNEKITILKKSLFGILISFLFSAAIIGCLLYLLQIIRQQKKLAEIKNDLINNITHEFKTPIATIGAAMEGIQIFNPENNSEKNQRYAKISLEQVLKLNTMVEKLLETATLDSDLLNLNTEPKNLVEILKNIAKKDDFIIENKKIDFYATENEIKYNIDVFHLENAFNNILDNAIKYGGAKISVTIERTKSGVKIKVSDNGNSLSEIHKKQVFEKFYRVPKGNLHDIKGFGIGLYYAKSIIEKHKGALTLSLKPTTFKIELPNEK